MAAEKNDKKKKGDSGGMMKLVLLYVGAMVVMTVVAVVLVVVVIGPKMGGATPVAPQPQETQQAQQATGQPNGLAEHVVPLGEFIVNPSGAEGLRYLAVDISVAVASAEKEALITKYQAQLSHTVVDAIKSKTLSELEEPGAMDAMGEAIQAALNEIFGEGSIQKVFFPRFIIQ